MDELRCRFIGVVDGDETVAAGEDEAGSVAGRDGFTGGDSNGSGGGMGSFGGGKTVREGRGMGL